MILLFVGVFLLILLVCLLFFYRRRSSADYNAPMMVDKLDESYQDDGSRAIKFGNMPSYRYGFVHFEVTRLNFPEMRKENIRRIKEFMMHYIRSMRWTKGKQLP